MEILPFLPLLPDLSRINQPEDFFQRVKENFQTAYQAGIYRQAAQELIFVYEIRNPQGLYRGLLAGLPVQAYLQQRIRPHEAIILSRAALHRDLITEFQALIKPILLTYPSVPAIQHWLADYAETQAPALTITLEQGLETHRFWAVANPVALQYLQELFAILVPAVYIADGHHRAATLAAMAEQASSPATTDSSTCLFAALFPSSDLEIHDFNRVVAAVPPAEELWASLEQLFLVEALTTPAKPQAKHQLTLYVDQRWFRLCWRPEILDRYRWEKAILDVHLFNELVLRDSWGVVDVRNDPRLHYVEGPKDWAGVVAKCEQLGRAAGFCLYPVAAADLFLLADHQQVLPPKSTWFEPRMRNGLVVCRW